VFSVSRFHVPQGRSKIAPRFIAGLWREHKTSPVRDERTHRSSPIFSVAPTGLWPFSNRHPRLKPVETVGYFRSSLSGLWDPCSSVVQHVCDPQLFRMQCCGGNIQPTPCWRTCSDSQSRAPFENPNGIPSQSPGLRGTSPSRSETLCLFFRFPLGHRPTNIPNRNAVEVHPFPPARLISATTPLALLTRP